jgi:hypothetical protein
MARGQFLNPIELDRIKLLYSQGLSENAIAMKINRSRTLVHKAVIDNHDSIITFNEAVAIEKADVYTDLIGKGLGIIDEKMSTPTGRAAISAASAAKIVGILFDKRQLLIGEPTAIEDQNVSLEQRNEAARIIEAFGELAPENSGGGAEKNSREEPLSICPAVFEPSPDEKNE